MLAIWIAASISTLSYAASEKVIVVSSVEELPDITEIFADALSKIHPSATIDEFRAIMPDAKPRGFVDSFQVFELNTKTFYRVMSKSRCFWVGEAGDDCSDHIYKQTLWFGFQNGQLKNWGKPGDFKKSADVVIENRQ
jgi:hypothetical protein